MLAGRMSRMSDTLEPVVWVKSHSLKGPDKLKLSGH
jgi:hypothetical protein